jgi:MFS family permease
MFEVFDKHTPRIPYEQQLSLKEETLTQDSRTTTSSPLWTKAFVAITVVNFLLFSGFHMLTSTLALYTESLGASELVIGIVTSSTTIAGIIVRPVVGAALDKYGRKGLFLVGILGLCISITAVPWVPLISIVLALRIAQGVAWAIANTAASTIVADVIPKDRFGEGIGFFGLSSSIAMTFAPALSLTVYDFNGIMLPMLISASVVLVAFFVALTLKYQKIERPQLEQMGQGDGSSVPPLAPTKQKLLERSALPAALMGFFCLSGYGTVLTFVAVYARHIGVDGIAWFFVAMSGVMLFSRPLFGRFVDKRGYAIPVLLGLAFIIVGFILLSFTRSTLALVICAAVFGVGYGAVIPSLQTMAVVDASPDRRGSATATFFIGFDAGIGFGSITAGMVAGFIGYSNMYLLAIVLPLITALLYLTIGRRRRRS